MDPELLKALTDAGMTPEQLRMLAPQLQMGQEMMQPQHAQGREVGAGPFRTFVASSPLEHLANAVQQGAGAYIANKAMKKQQELLEQQRQARQTVLGGLNTAQFGGQGGTLGEAGGGMARPPDPGAAQALMTAMAGSGDSALQAGAHFGLQSEQLARQNSILQNTMRHQQVLEEQGQGRLDQGQQRVDQGDDKVELLRQRLAQGLVKFNSNTGQFENVGGLVKPPRALPRSTGNAAPAAPPATPPGGGGNGPPVPPLAAQPLAGKMLDKALKELGSDFDPSSGRSGEFGKNQVRVNAAKRLLTLAEDEQGNPRDLTPQQMPELSQALAGLIGGSAGAQSQIEHLTPHSISGDYAKIAQWLTNEPHGSGQQAFVKNMIETAKREQGVAQQGIESVRQQRGAKHQRVLMGNPNESRKVLQGFGWDLGPDGLPVQAQPAAAPTGSATPSATPDTAALRKKYGL